MQAKSRSDYLNGPGSPHTAARREGALRSQPAAGSPSWWVNPWRPLKVALPESQHIAAPKEAAAVLWRSSRVRLVQFHPSYAYEDFVEGYRSRLVDGQAIFELVPGPLRRLARQAISDPAHRYFLITDEMNRGNVTKVLGEPLRALGDSGDQ
jgi:hypothetical protein